MVVANGLGNGACDENREANGVFCGGAIFDDAPNGAIVVLLDGRLRLLWFITLDDMAKVMEFDPGGGGVVPPKPNGFGAVVMDDALGKAEDGGTVNVDDDTPNNVGCGIEESIIDVPKGVIGGGGC